MLTGLLHMHRTEGCSTLFREKEVVQLEVDGNNVLQAS